MSDNFISGARNVLALLNRFGSNEEYGFFKGTVQVQEELAHTSWLTDILHHRFPKCGELFLHWTHQLPDPQAGRMDIALYVSATLGGPVVPVAVVEVGFKGSSKQWQAAAYAVNISPQLRDGNRGLLSLELSLGDPHATPQTVLRCYAAASSDEIQAHEGQKFLWTTTVWRGDGSESNLARVFQALVEAAPIAINKLESSAFQRVGANVCISNGQVMKLFDYRYRSVAKDQRRSPALSSEYLKAQTLLHDNDLEVIGYPLVQGLHHASCVQQMMDVIEELLLLHNKDICHGDIRAYNILFCKDSHSHLIDFDFAGECGSKKYPAGYSHDINDAKRHEKAIAAGRLAKDHDSFSLASVMDLHACEQADQWKSIIELVRKNQLDEAIAKMKTIVDVELKPNEILLKISQGATGSLPRK
jgi:hypothetical protein